MAEQLAGLLPIILAVAVFYLLIIRPARRRQREMVSVQQQLSPGVQVMTTSGLYATVREVTEGRIVLETGPGVYSTWARNAIARVEAAPSDQTLDLTDGRNTPTDVSTEQGADGRRTDRPGS